MNLGFGAVPTSAASAAVPAAAVYLLEKADRCAVATVAAGTGFPQLLTAPFGGQDPMLPARAVQTARCLEAVPVRRLRFSRDAAELKRLLFSTRSG